MIKKNLQTVLYCCWEREFAYYGSAFKWQSILPQLHNSNDNSIQVAAKFLSSNLSCSLAKSFQFLWKLKPAEVTLMLDIFKQTYFKEKNTGVHFRIIDLLLGFQRLIEADKDNLKIIMTEIWMILNWAVKILANGTLIERTNMGVLLCMLLQCPEAKETLLTSTDLFFLHKIHEAASAPINNALKDLLNCVVCTIKDEYQLGNCTQLIYVFMQYTDHISMCL